MNIIKIFLEIVLSLVMVSGNCVGIVNSIKKDVEAADVSKIQKEITTSNEKVKETPEVITNSTPKPTQTKLTMTTQKQETPKPTATTPKQETTEKKEPTPTPRTDVQEQPINNTTPVISEKPKETFETNYEMIEKMKQTIKANESEYMQTYGYEIVVDSSIKPLTNGFTFTELRLKYMLKHKFGTIKIYAENYCVGGELVMVNCYIL